MHTLWLTDLVWTSFLLPVVLLMSSSLLAFTNADFRALVTDMRDNENATPKLSNNPIRKFNDIEVQLRSPSDSSLVTRADPFDKTKRLLLPPAQCGPATDKPGRFRSALACLHELQTRLKDKSWTVDPGPSRCDQICCLGYAEVILCNDNNDAAITFSAVWLGQMVEAILDQCYGKNVEQGTIRGQQWGMVNVGGGEVSMSKEHNANIIVRHAETCPFFLGSLNPYLIEDYLDLDEYPKFDKAVVQYPPKCVTLTPSGQSKDAKSCIAELKGPNGKMKDFNFTFLEGRQCYSICCLGGTKVELCNNDGPVANVEIPAILVAEAVKRINDQCQNNQGQVEGRENIKPDVEVVIEDVSEGTCISLDKQIEEHSHGHSESQQAHLPPPAAPTQGLSELSCLVDGEYGDLLDAGTCERELKTGSLANKSFWTLEGARCLRLCCIGVTDIELCNKPAKGVPSHPNKPIALNSAIIGDIVEYITDRCKKDRNELKGFQDINNGGLRVTIHRIQQGACPDFKSQIEIWKWMDYAFDHQF